MDSLCEPRSKVPYLGDVAIEIPPCPNVIKLRNFKAAAGVQKSPGLRLRLLNLTGRRCIFENPP